MKKNFLSGVLVFMLSGCVATEISTQGKKYDAQTDSRIRIYGQNGRPSSMIVEIDGKKEKISIGGGLGQAFSSMVGAKDNESIGMPETILSKDPSAHSKLLSGIFFKEFIIPAGKEIEVTNSILGSTNKVESTDNITGVKTTTITTVKGCTGNIVKFVPEAGKDYEVAPISSDRKCGVTVYEIK
ncbi:hypothetical protein ACWIW6_06180 [Ursidibacter sp. B-7004-1]